MTSSPPARPFMTSIRSGFSSPVATSIGSARPSLTSQTVDFPPNRATAPRGTLSASARSPVTNSIITYWPGRNRRPVFSTSASTTAVRAVPRARRHDGPVPPDPLRRPQLGLGLGAHGPRRVQLLQRGGLHGAGLLQLGPGGLQLGVGGGRPGAG